MNRKNRNIAEWAFYALIGGLLLYAASRTLDFVQGTLAADKQIIGYLYLLATGIGAVIWLYVYLTYAEGSKQRGIAFIMGIADLIGEMILVYADTVRVASANGQMTMTGQELNIFITASVAIIGLNILAGYAFKLFDPNAEAAAHARDMADEVRDAAVKKMNTPTEKQRMANELAPILEAAMFEQVSQEIRTAAGQYRAIPAPEIFRPKRLTIEPAPAVKQEQPVPGQRLIHPEHILYYKGDNPADYYDPTSEFALPCGHTAGESWNKERRVRECNVCGAVRDSELQALKKDQEEQPSQAGDPDNYGPEWENQEDISPTLDAYAWVCLNCDGHNPPYTRKCQWCQQPRTNKSPVTPFADLPPTPQPEAGQKPNPFRKSE